MNQNSAGCVNLFVSGFSRLVLLMFWISRPVQWASVFGDSWLLPCLGFIFLPFTTLMYAWLQLSQPGPLTWFEWAFIGIAVLCDVLSAAGAGYSNRNRLPPGVPGSTSTRG